MKNKKTLTFTHKVTDGKAIAVMVGNKLYTGKSLDKLKLLYKHEK